MSAPNLIDYIFSLAPSTAKDPLIKSTCGSTINKILSILYLKHAAIAATISSIRSNTNTIPIATTTGSHNGASTHHHDHVATAVVPVNLRITNTMAIAVNRLEPLDV